MVIGRTCLALNISKKNSLGKCTSLWTVLPETHAFLKILNFSIMRFLDKTSQISMKWYALVCIFNHLLVITAIKTISSKKINIQCCQMLKTAQNVLKLRNLTDRERRPLPLHPALQD